MIAKDFLPIEPLREYINLYRLRHFVFTNEIIPQPKPFPPRPEQSMTFYIRGYETARYLSDGTEVKKCRSVISGQFTNRIDRFVSFPEFLMIAVDFKPGALHRLTGIPFTEFTNKELDAETVLCADLKRINERLTGMDSYQEMVQEIEAFLICLIKRRKPKPSGIDHLLIRAAQQPDCSVDWLASNAYLSPRQLERKFNERIGVSPKTFLRIARFNQSYWLHLKNPELSWFQVAMTCCYTDYNHMAKEYKQFANASPANFFVQEKSAPGRILGLTK